jgi:LacI family transcriptional regulator
MKRPVSMRDVAALAGVSVGTVSNALNRPHLVSERNRDLVERSVRELDFVRNGAAQQLRVGKSPILGMVVWTISNPFFADLAHATEEEAEKLGLNVLIGSSDHTASRESRYLELFELQNVRGLFVVPLGAIPPQLERLRSRGTPLVLLGKDHPAEFSTVALDGELGGHLAARHLIETGRRRLAFVGGPLWQVVDRLTGVNRAVNEEPGATLAILDTPDMTAVDGHAIGRRISELPPDERPNGIVAANDLVALGILQALAVGSSIRVPEDIAVIGYDDIDFAASSIVPLSSIRQPRDAIAKEAVRMLLAQDESQTMAAPENVVLAPQLVVRESTRAVG